MFWELSPKIPNFKITYVNYLVKNRGVHVEIWELSAYTSRYEMLIENLILWLDICCYYYVILQLNLIVMYAYRYPINNISLLIKYFHLLSFRLPKKGGDQ